MARLPSDQATKLQKQLGCSEIEIGLIGERQTTAVNYSEDRGEQEVTNDL